MSRVEEFYKNVVRVTCEVFKVDPVDMMSFNREICVSARGVLVMILLDRGLSEQLVADMTGLTRRGVNRIKNEFPERIRRSWMIYMCDREIRNKIGTSME